EDGLRDVNRDEQRIAVGHWGQERGANGSHQRDATGHEDESAGQRDGAIPQREVEQGRYSHTSGRITGLCSSPRTLPPMRRLQSTGTSVTDRIVAPAMANVLVYASG